MPAERSIAGLRTQEELREVILGQRRELDALRREADDAKLLIDALDSLLDVSSDEDPFSGVFGVLEPVFSFTHALVLSERDGPGSPLRCIVASSPGLVGREWAPGRFFEKVLSGRVTASVSGHSLGDWPDGTPISPAQPALYLPLGFRDSRGLIMLLRGVGASGFDRHDIALARKLSLLASHAFATRLANTSERERLRLHDLTEELEAARAMLAHRANHDLLTGLPNRAAFDEHVEHALSTAAGDGHLLALAFIDLDGFKQVNDQHGHDVGDGLLTAVAGRVRAKIRGEDVLARISGDEFVLLIDPVIDRDALDRVIARILAALKEPFTIGRTTVAVSASIGLAVFPDHGSSYEELRRNADVAMYSAKHSSRGSVAIFDAELGRAAAARTELEQLLREAVAERRFRAVLQPKVDLRLLRVSGFEALARYVDADGALRPPAEFIELASQLGLLDRITEILLDEIEQALPSLDAAFGADTTVSVNISACQAADPATMRTLLERLDRTGHSQRFILELTEDALLQVDVFQREIAPLLREFRVRGSIDDFGTGFASLSRLLEISVHELKIDRAFITDVHAQVRSQVILEALASACAHLGVSVVAEGVETEEEVGYLLCSTSIGTAQGYFFAPPKPVEHLVALRDEVLANVERLRPLLVRDRVDARDQGGGDQQDADHGDGVERQDLAALRGLGA